MRQLRFWRFVLSFAVLYGLLILPWPGLHYAVGAYVQEFGSHVFGQSGRAFMASLDKSRPGAVTTTIHHVVLFRAKGPIDRSYSDATDTVVVLYNFDVIGKNKIGGSKIGLESKNYFWLPFAFYLALVGATPMSWRRRMSALFWGFLTANALLALTLAIYIVNHAADISMIVLSPFWTWAARGLLELLLVVSGPSTFIYLLIWPFACFRREDMAGLVAGWGRSIPKPVVTDAIPRQERRALLQAARKLGPLANRASRLSTENANSGKQTESTKEVVAGGSTTARRGLGGGGPRGRG